MRKHILNIIYKAIAVILIMPLYHVRNLFIRKKQQRIELNTPRWRKALSRAKKQSFKFRTNNCLMKMTFIILLFFSFIENGTAQKDNKEIEFHSISLSPLSIYFADRDGGLGANIDVSFNSENHIFKIYVGGASEFTINLGGESIKDSFGEYNLLYGRELNIKKWLGIDLFTGVGFFNFVYNGGSSSGEYKKGVIGFPLQSKN